MRVNCVAPGAIETEMFDAVPGKVKEKFIRRIPLGRLGSPADVARLHLFLASDEASYITGTVLMVDAGLTAFHPSGRQLQKGQAAFLENAKQGGSE